MANFMMWLNFIMLGAMAVFAVLYLRELGKNRIIENFFGRDFIEALKKRDGVLFWRFDSSGDSDFFFAPSFKKDESFYYLELPKPGTPEGKEKIHYKVNKKDLYKLRGRLNVAIVVEDSIAAISPEVLDKLTHLSPLEKARLLNGYAKYHSLKAQRENILRAMKYENDKDKIETLKKKLKDIEHDMAEIREKYAWIFQEEADLNTTLIIPDEKEKKVIILRPVRIDEVADFLESTRPDELVYTVKKMLIDWQQVVLESLKKLIYPRKGISTSKSSILTTILMAIGAIIIFIFILGRI